jgi:hypothetical protein
MRTLKAIFTLNPKNLSIAFTTFILVCFLIFAKFFLHRFGGELLTTNTLFGSAIAGGTFICSFLLAGVIGDYKESDKMPAEIRSSLETILDEGEHFSRKLPSFDRQPLKNICKEILHNFFNGLTHEQNHENLKPALESINKLSPLVFEMEKSGMIPNYIVRIKVEQTALRKNILRIYHIQKSNFIPSAYVLASTIVFLIIGLLLLVKTEGSPESLVFFGFISYMYLYIIELLHNIEKPFREGDSTMDDVSLFLLHELEERLETKHDTTN